MNDLKLFWKCVALGMTSFGQEIDVPHGSTIEYIGFNIGQKLRVKKSNIIKLFGILPSNSWYKGLTSKDLITSITFVDEYVPTGNEIESWAADVNEKGSIMCYIVDTGLIISANSNGTIMAHKDSSEMFSHINNDLYRFKNVTSISGVGLLDTTNMISMRGMFANCTNLNTIS